MNCTCLDLKTFFDFSNTVFQVFLVFAAVFLLSLLLNFTCCISKCRSGKAAPGSKRICLLSGLCPDPPSRGSHQMEDNPIYGNLTYGQTTNPALTAEAGSTQQPEGSSPATVQPRTNPDEQFKTQDCYANLTLKAVSRPACVPCSGQIQYSALQVEDSRTEDERQTDAVSSVSDLYASVQSQRNKTVDNADCRDAYANYLWKEQGCQPHKS